MILRYQNEYGRYIIEIPVVHDKFAVLEWVRIHLCGEQSEIMKADNETRWQAMKVQQAKRKK